MKAKILENGNLKLTISSEDQMELDGMKRDLGIEFESDQTMWDWFEKFIANSEYIWIDPHESGDLTDAPILGILGTTHPLDADTVYPYPTVNAGFWDGKHQVTPIAVRWAWMHYEVESLLEHLRRNGKAILLKPA